MSRITQPVVLAAFALAGVIVLAAAALAATNNAVPGWYEPLAFALVTGGSVTDRMTSRMTTVAPRGCQSRLNDRMNSTTTRAISSSQKMKSAKPMMCTNSVNESPTFVMKQM